MEHENKEFVVVGIFTSLIKKHFFLAEIENKIACKIQLKQCQNSRIEIPDDFCDHHILRKRI